MRYAMALVLALMLNAAANLMMKVGVTRLRASGFNLEQGVGAVGWSVLSNWVLVVGLLCFAINVAFYTYSLSGLRISVAYPIMVSGGFAIIAIVAWKYLHETLSYGQWAGIAFIMVGVYLVAREMNQTAPG